MTNEEYIARIKNDPTKKDAMCKKCGRKYKYKNDPGFCPFCHIKVIPLDEPHPKCPTCGSINIESVSQTRRSLNRWAFGINNPTARAQFECKNCGYKW